MPPPRFIYYHTHTGAWHVYDRLLRRRVHTRTPPRWQRKAWPATMRLPGVGCVTAGNRPSGGTSSSDALGAARHADGPRWSFNTADRPHPPAYHRLRRLACARGDATSTPPASTACRAPRLRAAVLCACASPARVGMLLARLFHLLFMAQGPGRHARPWGEHDAFPCPAERYHTSGAMLAANTTLATSKIAMHSDQPAPRLVPVVGS